MYKQHDILQVQTNKDTYVDCGNTKTMICPKRILGPAHTGPIKQKRAVVAVYATTLLFQDHAKLMHVAFQMLLSGTKEISK